MAHLAYESKIRSCACIMLILPTHFVQELNSSTIAVSHHYPLSNPARCQWEGSVLLWEPGNVFPRAQVLYTINYCIIAIKQQYFRKISLLNLAKCWLDFEFEFRTSSRFPSLSRNLDLTVNNFGTDIPWRNPATNSKSRALSYKP